MLSVWCQGFKSGLNLEEKLFQELRNARILCGPGNSCQGSGSMVEMTEKMAGEWTDQGGKKEMIKEKALIINK